MLRVPGLFWFQGLGVLGLKNLGFRILVSGLAVNWKDSLNFFNASSL